METWLCIKDGAVVNMVFADETFMATDAFIGEAYDSYMKKDDPSVPPEVKIGSVLINDQWKTDVKSPDKTDYSNQNIAGKRFNDCDLTNCNFSGADISNCDFDGAYGQFSLVGAIWNGAVIKHGPVWIKNELYFFMITDVFTQMGCILKKTSDVAGMEPDEVSGSDPKNPEKPAKFWLIVKDEFLALLKSWGM